ncbi:hypothetical protein E2C06_36610 [Dankookia rubra]|uniref:Uncharacterized protein n=1 Tax=Dankookia rubra TaxID=1442381 RepID=A0A4R5PYS3_9PROT|nr:hypothetical protein [Dankookia rubra]TDH54701.1 hypothetical protein E2C06_36610 [Dankookia rubra]
MHTIIIAMIATLSLGSAQAADPASSQAAIDAAVAAAEAALVADCAAAKYPTIDQCLRARNEATRRSR